MTQQKTSFTAFAVLCGIEKLSRDAAWSRLIAPEMAAVSRLFVEQGADSTLKRIIRALPLPAYHFLLNRLYVPGMGYHFLFRKILIQQQVETAITHGLQQLIVLGGGFDSLCIRMARQYPHLSCFEIDLPQTQQRKLSILQQSLNSPPNAYWLPANLAETSLQDVLTAHPTFKIDAPTLVILEGVLMYLRDTEVQVLFRAMHTLFSNHLQVLFGAIAQSDDAGSLPLRLINTCLKNKNEGTHWYCPAAAMPAFMAESGYHIEGWISYRALQQMFRSADALYDIPLEDENYYTVAKIPLSDANARKQTIAETKPLGVSNPFTS